VHPGLLDVVLCLRQLSRVRSALTRIALAAGAVLALLATLELVSGALGMRPLAEEPAFGMRGAALACRFDPSHIDFCDAERVRAQRDPKRKLILVLGGSSVVGYPERGRNNIPQFARMRLESLLPGTFEVVKLAQPCKDSIYIRRCALRALGADPAALVIYEAHNDFSGHTGPHPRLSFWMAEHGYALFRLEQLLGRTRFWTLLSTRGSGRASIDRDPAGQLDPEASVRAQREVRGNVLANFAQVIEAAAAKNIPVVIVTLVSNLDEFPERRERWDAVLAEADAPGRNGSAWLASYADGIRAFRGGRLEASLAAFERARDARPLSRAPGMLNEALRELPARYGNVVLVDFERELRKVALAEGGGIGCNFFGDDRYCDGLHPNARTSELIGRAAADGALRAILGRKAERAPVAHDAPGGRTGEVRPEDERAASR
jgi:hypothetical protein